MQDAPSTMHTATTLSLSMLMAHFTGQDKEGCIQENSDFENAKAAIDARVKQEDMEIQSGSKES